MDSFYKNYTQVIEAADYCVTKHLTLPALILIYSAIDSAGWVASSNQKKSVNARFTDWVNNWMLKDGKLKCTAEELYAARCGVLHTLTPNSSLSKNKGVRKIAYAWGKAKTETLVESISELSMESEIASIHIDDLFTSFKEGLANYLEYAFKNAEEKENILLKSNQHFVNMESELMDLFIKEIKNDI